MGHLTTLNLLIFKAKPKKEVVAMELVGTFVWKGEVKKIFRQFDPEGFKYFVEEEGKLRPFENAFEGYCSVPYPLILDQWIDRASSVDLKVYHIEDDDWDAEIGGWKIREWCEKAMQYYESEDDLGCWREYWGLLMDERETLFYFFEKFFREKKNVSQKEWWKLAMFRRVILNFSLGEYRERIIDSFVERMAYVLEGEDFERPKNIAKGLLVWLDEHEDLGDMLNGLYEWDYLTAEETEEMENAIYFRLEELAEEEEEWAGLSVEEWLDLLKKELIARGEIRDTDRWVLDLWKNWLRYYIDRLEPYEILHIVFEGNPDYDWMPYRERRRLGEAVIDLIKEKLKEENLKI
jgi:hypothetical protein